MSHAAPPPSARLAAVRRTGLLDTPPEEAFDRLTRLASSLLDVPIALLTLVDAEHDFLKSHFGMPEPVATTRRMAASPAFCRRVAERGEVLLVEDAHADPEVARYPAVTDYGVRAFLGAPLTNGDGEHLGSFAVVDWRPRAWSARDVRAVRDLAAAASTEIELRTEVAERRRAEAALRRSEARLAEAQRVGHIGAWEWDVAKGEVHWSPELYRLCGLEPSDAPMTMAAFYETVHPHDRDFVRAQLARRLAAAVPFGYRYRVLARDGEARTLSGRGEPVFDADGRVVRLLGTTQDVTAQVRAEDALRASEARFRSLIEHAADMIAIIDADGTFRYASPAHTRHTGYSIEELNGSNAFALIHPDDLGEVSERLAEAMTRPGRPLAVQYRFRHKDGSWRTASTVGTNLLHDPGIRGIVINSQDITERTELEARLRQAQKLEAIGRLAGGVAHDFNNLLTVIGTHARFALDAVPARAPARAELEAIEGATLRATALTRQLLAFSRKQILKPEALDLNAVVRGLEPMLRRLIGEDIAIDARLAPGLGRVLADPTQLEQVLVNLAVNARDAMPEGGRLLFETEDVALTARDVAALVAADDAAPLEPGAYVRLVVSDTGLGMDEATMARMWEPFFTTKPPGSGTGLGLSTVYGIVRQSGGAVRVTSAPGRGTRFELDLPRAAAVCPARTPVASRPAAGRGSGTVLLVEDEPAVRSLVRRVLDREGYTVLEAASGADALALLDGRDGPLDLVITDMVMPGMSGRAFADALATRRPEAPVLFMSGYTDDEIVRRGLLTPGMAFLEKPFSPERLLAAVRAARRAR